MTSQAQTEMVRAILEARGFKVRPEVPLGHGLYHGIRADFVIDNAARYPDGLAIECKWQNSTGSAQDKIAYTVLCIQRHYPIPAVLVCSGRELGPAYEWAMGEVGGQLVAVLDSDAFIAWASRLEKA